MRCISHDDTQARTRVFPQCCYRVLVHAHCPYTQGSRHHANVREPIRGCDSNLRDVRAMGSREVTSDFHSALKSFVAKCI